MTSAHVLDVEADIAGRLAVRGAEPGRDVDLSRVARAAQMTDRDLDAGQHAVIAALAGERSLIVVEGAAGAGKTTTLSATRDLLAAHGRRLTVVTPTLKAAKVAQSESARTPDRPGGWRSSTAGAGTPTAPGPGSHWASSTR